MKMDRYLKETTAIVIFLPAFRYNGIKCIGQYLLHTPSC